MKVYIVEENDLGCQLSQIIEVYANESSAINKVNNLRFEYKNFPEDKFTYTEYEVEQ